MINTSFLPLQRLYKYLRLILLLFLSTIGIVIIKNSNNNNNSLYFNNIHDKIYDSIPYSSNFCVIYDYWKAIPKYKNGDYITLILHSTPTYLNYLSEHIDTWNGGISISIFIPTPELNTKDISKYDDETLLIDLNFVQLHLQAIFVVLNKMKKEKLSGKVSLHLYFERKNYKKCPTLIFDIKKLNLNANINDLKEFLPSSDVYPINPGRNIARNGSKTRLFISGDIEQIFVKNFEKRIKKLANRVLLKENKKLVLVHRRFEMYKNITMPKNKNELKILLDNKQAYPFHKFVYNIGHNIPDLNEWLNINENFYQTTIFKILNYTNSEWEPQFIADTSIPYHDNRFPFRLRSHTHLATLLCYHGYQFAIVNDLFTMHRGIKKNESKKHLDIKQIYIKKGYKKMVNSFVNELNNKFPAMSKKCPLLLP